MADKIQIRRDTAANWATQNPVLSQGELGAETDTLKIKMGDASSTWNQLNYLIDTGNYATSAQLQTAVSDLVDAAPGALDTLNELAAALGDDPNFATTVTNAIALKATTSTLADVATSGDYTDLSNTPTIPAAYGDADVSAYLAANDFGTSTSVIAAITDSAPGTLDTLNELAAALGDDANFSTTVTNSIATKANSADLSAVATSGAYADLSGTPTLSGVATSGAYGDLTGRPTIPSDLTDVGVADGTAGQVLTTDGAGNFSFADTASSGGSFEAVASGVLANGDKVIINTNGTVSVVAATNTPDPNSTTIDATATVSSGAANHSSNYQTPVQWFPGTNRFVHGYADINNNGYDTFVIGTVDGNSITFGTPVLMQSSYYSVTPRFRVISATEFVVFHTTGITRGSSDSAQLTTGTVGGAYNNAITFSAAQTVPGTGTAGNNTGFLAEPHWSVSQQALLIPWRTSLTSGWNAETHGWVCTYNGGGSWAIGSRQSFSPGAKGSSDGGWHWHEDTATGKTILASTRKLSDGGDDQPVISFININAATYTITETSVSASLYVHDTGGGVDAKTMTATPNEVVAILRPYNGHQQRIRSFPINFATESFTIDNSVDPIVLETQFGNGSYTGLGYDSDLDRVLLTYGSYDAEFHVVSTTVTGSSLSFETPVSLGADTPEHASSRLPYNSHIGKSLWTGLTLSPGSRIVKLITTATSTASSNMTAENYVGIADAAYGDGVTATIQTAGAVDDAQSGLTPGQAYYVQVDGTLSTTAGDPRVFAGTAISTTELLIGKSPEAAAGYTDADVASYLTANNYMAGAHYNDSDVAAYLSANDYATATSTIATITDSAPATLDTLNELAAALGDDANFSTTVTNSIALKANSADLNAVATSGAYADLSGTPVLSGVATSGAYADLSGTPTIPSTLTDVGVTDGNAGQFLTTNGAGTFSFADVAAGGGGGSFEAVATGTLANGDPVVINSDGTVSLAGSSSIDPSTQGPGSNNSVTDEGTLDAPEIAILDSGVVVIGYRQANATGSGSYFVVEAGSVSGTNISFGTPVVVESVSSGNNLSLTRTGSDTFAIGYRIVAGEAKRLALGSVSGNTITITGRHTFPHATAGNPMFKHISYDPTADRLLMFTGSATSDNDTALTLGTISGGNITFGSMTTILTAPNYAAYWKSVFDSTSNQTIACYYGNTGSSYIVVSISGDTPTVSSENDLPNSAQHYPRVAMAGDKVVFSYQSTSSQMMLVAGTVSSGSISFGTPVEYTQSTYSGSLNHMDIAYSTAAQKLVIEHNGSNDGFATRGSCVNLATLSGTTITIEDSPFDLVPATNDGSVGPVAESRTAYEPSSDTFVHTYHSLSFFGHGRRARAVAFSIGTASSHPLTSENFVGFSDAAYAFGATATIQTAGAVDDAQTGLTAGEAYFVQPDGTLSTTAGDPSVFAGVALSATTLMIGKDIAAATYSDSDVAAYLAANDFATSTATIAAITDSAPATLDTLNELAAALGDDANFSTTVTNSIAAKANTADLNAVATSGAYADLSGTPTLAAVATSGAYGDITGVPTIPSALTDIGISDGTNGQVLTTNGAGTFSFQTAATPYGDADVSAFLATATIDGGSA